MELSPYTSRQEDFGCFNALSAEDSSPVWFSFPGSEVEDNSVVLSLQLGSEASTAFLPNIRYPSNPSCQIASPTEGSPYNRLIHVKNFNNDNTSSTDGFEKSAVPALSALWDDQRQNTEEKYTRSDLTTSNNGKIGTMETTGSTPSLLSLATIYSPKDKSQAPSIDSKRRLNANDGTQNQRQRKRRKENCITNSEREQYKFACPFRKHNPAKYGIQHGSGICALSQWDCISRLKEHLYRCHMAPSQCQRCGDTFKTIEELESHCKTVIACEFKSTVPPEGITPAILKTLKARKRLIQGESEEERWGDIYTILFPKARDIPSPYFEPVQEEPAQGLLDDYEDFSRQELPKVLRSCLDTHLPSFLNGNNLKEDLVSLMEYCHAKTLTSYRSRGGNDLTTSTSLIKALSAPTPVPVPASPTTTTTTAATDRTLALASSKPCSPIPFETDDNDFLSNSENFLDLTYSQVSSPVQKCIYSDQLRDSLS